ncbi:Alpha-snap [Hexamita inflata]|uniref:Alpha-snap n=1 Tax=Hexamita inflata TaxID=28002 RepID=A0ABP1GI01_9EUKA
MSKKEVPGSILAQQTFESAQKKAKKTLFHSPEYIDAVTEFVDAAKMFTKEGLYKRAAESYELAAENAKKADTELSAAVYYRDAANSLAKGVQQGSAGCEDQKALELYQLSSNVFQRAGKFLDSARSLLAASCYCKNKLDKPKLLSQAMELFQQENKPNQAAAAVSDLIDELIDGKSFQEAANIIPRAIQMYSKMKGYGHKVDAMCLTFIIISLTVDDTVGAETYLDKFDNFNGDEYQMAEQLVNAFKNKSRDELEIARKNLGGKLALGNSQLYLLRDLKIGEDV